MIKSYVQKEKDLTVHTCSGKITVEEILKAVKSFYDGDPTTDSLWDLTGADVSLIESEDIRRIAYFAKNYTPQRRDGKTALVSPKDVAYGFGRMYQAFANISGQQVEVRVFRNLEEAEEWLAPGGGAL